MVQVPLAVFEKVVNDSFSRTIRPPSKRYLGKVLRAVAAFPIVRELWEHLTTPSCLPEHIPASESSVGMHRSEDGKILPIRSTGAWDRFKIKIQDPEHVAQFCKMETRNKMRGWRAAMLINKKGRPAKKVAMAAAPMIVTCSIPKGKAVFERLPSLSYKMNVITMDENAEVTFGNKTYPSSVRRLACMHNT